MEKKESVSFSKPPPDVSQAIEPQAMPKSTFNHTKDNTRLFALFSSCLFFSKRGSLDVLICTMQIHLCDTHHACAYHLFFILRWQRQIARLYSLKLILFLKLYSKSFKTLMCRFKFFVSYCSGVVAVTLGGCSGLQRILNYCFVYFFFIPFSNSR